jgi:hypothetical protein
VYSQRVNMLDELKAMLTATLANSTEDYRWDIFTGAGGTREVFCLLTACLLVHLCTKTKTVKSYDYVVSTSVIISVFLQKLQMWALFLEGHIYAYQHCGGACCPHHQSSPNLRSLLLLQNIYTYVPISMVSCNGRLDPTSTLL